jgi:hypothetical protein
MVFVQAKVVDATHLELSKPIPGPPGRKVLVSVAESSDADGDHEPWLTLSIEGLRSAYGESEPEYGPSTGREQNPEYEA